MNHDLAEKSNKMQNKYQIVLIHKKARLLTLTGKTNIYFMKGKNYFVYSSIVCPL
jgi:hypothetical protein